MCNDQSIIFELWAFRAEENLCKTQQATLHIHMYKMLTRILEGIPTTLKLSNCQLPLRYLSQRKGSPDYPLVRSKSDGGLNSCQTF